MKRNSKLIFIATVVSLYLSFSSVSAKDVLTPAMFESNLELASGSLDCPDKVANEAAATIYCDVIVTQTGAVDGTSLNCMARNEYGEFAEKIPHALTYVKFSPASINGHPIAIKAPLKVVAKKVKEGCVWVAVLNNGHSSQKYGVRYVAPQEVIEGSSFMSEYVRKIRKSFGARTLGNPGKPYVDVVRLMIRDDGQISKIWFEPRAAKPEIKRILRSVLKNRRFIPGQKDGQAFTMETMLLTGGDKVTSVSSYADQVVTFDDK